MAPYLMFIVISIILIVGADLAAAQGYTYLGCFYDDFNRDILPDLIYCDRTREPYNTCRNECGPEQQLNYCQSDSMTIELCRDICLDQNMRYFGVQAGSQCLCGGDFAPYDSLGTPTGSENDTCSAQCKGNTTQFCGGEFQASVYRFDAPQSHCFNPGYVLNGDQSLQADAFYNVNDTIDYAAVCPQPSIKAGPATISCTTAGNWTDEPPTCTVRCAMPTAPDYAIFSSGQTVNTSFAVDDEVLFDCINDPSKTNRVLTCDYYGNWITSVTCPGDPTTPSPVVTTMMTSTISTPTQTTQWSTPTSSASSTSNTEAMSSSSNSSPSSSSTAPPSSGTPVAMSTASGKEESTTVGSDAQDGGGMDMIIIIVAAVAGVLVVILLIVVISVCCSRKRKRLTKNIPFDPALGTSFGNPAFQEDETDSNQRGHVKENDYGDLHHQTYDIGVSDYAIGDESGRAPPDGKDSAADASDYNGGLDRNRNGSVSSFKPEQGKGHVSWSTLPPPHKSIMSNDYVSEPYATEPVSPNGIEHSGPSEEFFSNPDNQIATPL